MKAIFTIMLIAASIAANADPAIPDPEQEETPECRLIKNVNQCVLGRFRLVGFSTGCGSDAIQRTQRWDEDSAAWINGQSVFVNEWGYAAHQITTVGTWRVQANWSGGPGEQWGPGTAPNPWLYLTSADYGPCEL